MTAERWRQIESLFVQLLECPPSDRPSLLDRVCVGDDDLRRELESLLACDSPDQQLIEIPSSTATLSGNSAPATDVVGRRVGAYRLTGLIGHGGMGAVYLGVRDDDQYQKQVAIKLLKRGMDTDFMLNRFRQERQILANLEHPFIARLLDGGATEDGLPYFVMEYVDGIPITKYCVEKRLSIPEKLRLFRLVCEAVQYAHQNLVVHRDIKPSNILTTREGVPKLLDFGIAKVLDPKLSSAVTHTEPQFRMLTPDYASPEQVKGLSISTASDIYSLGAVFYELLTGQRPHRFDSHSMLDIEKTICEADPEKPSLATDSKYVRRQISGDLDNIVLTAMRKEPQRRYASAAELSEDIRRHMEALPIVAQEDRWTYRASKFVRRHRLAVGTAVLLVATLIGGIGAATFQARRAERRFQIVRGLANSMLFDVHDEVQQLPGSTKARALMMETVLRYLDNLARDSSGDPSLDLEIAKAYHRVAAVEGHPFRPNLGKASAALSHYRKALEIDERLANNPQTRSQAIEELVATNIEVGDIQAMLGNPQGARSQFQKAAAIAAAAQNSGELSQDSQINVYIRLGDEERHTGMADAALPHYRKALEVAQEWAAIERKPEAQRALRVAHVRMATILFESGNIFGARDNYETARRLNAELLQSADGSDDRWAMVQTLRALGDVLGGPEELSLGDTNGALARYREAAARAEILASADPQDVRARRVLIASYGSLGRVRLEGDPQGALAYYSKSLAIAEDLFRTDESNIEYRRDVALASLAVARCSRRLRKTSEALQLLTRSVDLQQPIETVAPQRIWMNRPLGWIYLEVGNVLLDRGDTSGALNNFRTGLAVAERLLTRAPSSLYLQRDLAEALETVGHGYMGLAARPGIPSVSRMAWRAEARSVYQRSLAVWQGWNSRKLATPYAGRRIVQARALIASVDES